MKDTFNRILSEACEYKIWKIASPHQEAAKLAATTKQQQLPQDNDFVNHVMVAVYNTFNTEKNKSYFKRKSYGKMVQWISKPK